MWRLIRQASATNETAIKKPPEGGFLQSDTLVRVDYFAAASSPATMAPRGTTAIATVASSP